MKLTLRHKKHSKSCNYAHRIETLSEASHVDIHVQAAYKEVGGAVLGLNGFSIREIDEKTCRSMAERLLVAADRLKARAAEFEPEPVAVPFGQPATT